MADHELEQDQLSNDTIDSLPEGWTRTSIGDLSASIDYGYTASAVKEAVGPKLLRITDIQGGRVDWDTVPHCRLDNLATRFTLERGDIVFARTGATTGKSFLIHDCPKNAVYASYLIRVRSNEKAIPEFLYLFFQSSAYWEMISENVSGNAQPNCNATKLSNLPVPLPPLAEQRRIVAKVEAVLARVNAARERLAKVPTLLKRFRQSILAAACSGRLTADWRLHRGLIDGSEEQPALWKERLLSDLCAEFNYGSSAKSAKEGRVPVLRMGNLQDGKLDWNDLAFTSDSNEIEKYALQPNTVLFNRTNSPELVGKTALYRGERPAVYAGYLIRIVNGPELDPHFLNFALNAPIFRDYCASVKTDGVSQSNINAKKLAAYPLNWCPIPEQREIVRRVEALFASADKIEARVAAASARAEKLIQSMLAKAFRGELVPTEAELAELEGREFETAQALLDRIHDERNRMAPSPGQNGSRRSASVARKAELRIK